MTRLEHFAAAALSGLVTQANPRREMEAMVARAWEYAELMEAEAYRRFLRSGAENDDPTYGGG